MKSYAVWFILTNDEGTNALRFATREEATAYGADLLSRWFLPTSFEVRESDDEVNYTYGPNGAQRINK